MSAAWEGLDEQHARQLAARSINRCRRDGLRGFTSPLQRLEGAAIVSLMSDDVQLARVYGRALVLVEESRDRGIAREQRERERRVHDHGPARGPGLGCPERTTATGQLRGACLTDDGRPVGAPSPGPCPARRYYYTDTDGVDWCDCGWPIEDH